jgi:hypothetical protein
VLNLKSYFVHSFVGMFIIYLITTFNTSRQVKEIDNSSFERVEEFRYFGTTLTNQNSIQEEIKSRLNVGIACYHSVQNLLSSRLLSRNLKIKIYRTIILFCMGVKLGR